MNNFRYYEQKKTKYLFHSISHVITDDVINVNISQLKSVIDLLLNDEYILQVNVYDLNNNELYISKYQDINNRKYVLVYNDYIHVGDNIYGSIVIYYNDYMLYFIKNLYVYISAFSLISLCYVIFNNLFFNKYVKEYIDKVFINIKQLEDGNFNIVDNVDIVEFSNIVSSFNNMSSTLKKREDSLRLYFNIIENNKSPIFILNSDLEIIYMNKMCINTFLVASDILTLDNKNNDITEWKFLLHNKRNFEIDLRGKDDNIISVTISSSIINFDNADNFVLYVSDNREKNKKEQQLQYYAYHDSVTGLKNRAYFIERLNDFIELDTLFAVIFIDLDRFKIINDSLGHNIGDEILKCVSNILLNSVSEKDIVSRFGGDEFAIILTNIKSAKDCIHICKNIKRDIKERMNINGHELYISGSFGLYINGYHNYIKKNADTILKCVDVAMYDAKNNGRDKFTIFTRKLNKQIEDTLIYETEIRKAIRNNEFELYYQPIINYKIKKLLGFEALVRWIHPTRGIISPGEFIPIAEESGLIIPLGLLILNKACEQLNTWNSDILCNDEKLYVTVNISPKQFSNRNLIDNIVYVINNFNMNPKNLNIEITESAIMENGANTKEILDKMKGIGVLLSLDDFGTGYSSLSNLYNYPVDVLKIDRSFVNRINDNGDNPYQAREIIKTVVYLAKILNKTVVAEGIETREQADILLSYGCDLMQGFYFSKPLKVDDAAAFIKNCAYNGE